MYIGVHGHDLHNTSFTITASLIGQANQFTAIAPGMTYFGYVDQYKCVV
jgi:hypothetical protein